MRGSKAITQSGRVHSFAGPQSFFQALTIAGTPSDIEGVNNFLYCLFFIIAFAAEQDQFLAQQRLSRPGGLSLLQKSFKFDLVSAGNDAVKGPLAVDCRQLRDRSLELRNFCRGKANLIQPQSNE